MYFFEVPIEQASNPYFENGVKDAVPSNPVSFFNSISRLSAASAITEATALEPWVPLPSLKKTESLSDVVISSIGIKTVGTSENNLLCLLAKAYAPALPEYSLPVRRQHISAFSNLKPSSANCFKIPTAVADGIRLALIPDVVFFPSTTMIDAI